MLPGVGKTVSGGGEDLSALGSLLSEEVGQVSDLAVACKHTEKYDY